jgi:hypothetical protein
MFLTCPQDLLGMAELRNVGNNDNQNRLLPRSRWYEGPPLVRQKRPGRTIRTGDILLEQPLLTGRQHSRIHLSDPFGFACRQEVTVGAAKYVVEADAEHPARLAVKKQEA